ncbi:hypothetical protein AMTRI_Chr11g152320 [Amborella trichopoda]
MFCSHRTLAYLSTIYGVFGGESSEKIEYERSCKQYRLGHSSSISGQVATACLFVITISPPYSITASSTMSLNISMERQIPKMQNPFLVAISKNCTHTMNLFGVHVVLFLETLD